LLVAALLSAVNAGPCDIYKARCCSQHRLSLARRQDIKPLTAGGIADAAAQDTFCQGSKCVISIIYDQSGKDNRLASVPGGGAKKTSDDPAQFDRLPITINGQKAYGVWIDSGMDYRNDKPTGVATGDDAEAMHVVADATHFNGGCCFDYGNAETTNMDDGPATMEALHLGNIRVWGRGSWRISKTASFPDGLGSVPGRYAQGPIGWHLRVEARECPVMTAYDGARPKGYEVMKKQGAIILGIGGDNSNGAVGSFHEGVMVSGDADNEVEDPGRRCGRWLWQQDGVCQCNHLQQPHDAYPRWQPQCFFHRCRRTRDFDKP